MVRRGRAFNGSAAVGDHEIGSTRIILVGQVLDRKLAKLGLRPSPTRACPIEGSA